MYEVRVRAATDISMTTPDIRLSEIRKYNPYADRNPSQSRQGMKTPALYGETPASLPHAIEHGNCSATNSTCTEEAYGYGDMGAWIGRQVRLMLQPLQVFGVWLTSSQWGWLVRT